MLIMIFWKIFKKTIDIEKINSIKYFVEKYNKKIKGYLQKNDFYV